MVCSRDTSLVALSDMCAAHLALIQPVTNKGCVYPCGCADPGKNNKTAIALCRQKHADYVLDPMTGQKLMWCTPK